ncbi:hypothetical protein [Litoribacter populi]|uniref:hypothetical protein n=1 Tax=Litoribacter populi TaxID=2598460 RepID=UPI00117EBEA4|nr:hypothetical protein [Litoribacter populi]
MLHAISSNKAGRSLAAAEVHWRQLFKASEDSLTSSVFGTLFHLPQELFWKILNDACLNGTITHTAPNIESVQYWPRWDADGTDKTSHVEPDIFIRTSELDLIVECKRYDRNQQDPNQWRNQYLAYLNEHKEAERTVILLAVGGLKEDGQEKVDLGKDLIMKVKKVNWTSILSQVNLVHDRLYMTKGYLHSIDSVLNILEEIMLAFEIHGYNTGKWLVDENFKPFRSIGSDPSKLYPLSFTENVLQ